MQFFKENKMSPIQINKMIQSLPKYMQPVASHLQKQEMKGGASLANSRFIQDTMTNFAPKAIFSRSKADLFDIGFLELSESMLVYYCPSLIGENIFRKAYSKGLDPNLCKKISTPLLTLKNDKTLTPTELSKIKPVKTAVALSSMFIPLTEYTLNFFKNLFTLKLFKQSDFNNIANLNKTKEKNESTEHQKKVEKSAKRNIIGAAAAFLGLVGLSALVLRKGENSKTVQKLADFILTPGDVLFKNNEKAKNTVNKYFSLDFADNNGKLGLSHGQLTSCVLIGGLGYFKAARDRGKQNFLETLFRYPLVGFYVITGSELLEKGFKKFLQNKKGYREIIDSNLNVKEFSALPETAQRLAKENGTDVIKEFKSLTGKKAMIGAVPFIFSIAVMGLFVAGVSRFFTQYRYDKEQKEKQEAFNKNFLSFEKFRQSLSINRTDISSSSKGILA